MGRCAGGARAAQEDVSVSKVCNVCRLDLPPSAFNARRASPDGLSYTCRVCDTARLKSRYRLKRTEIIARASEWARAHPERRREIVRESDARHRATRRAASRAYQKAKTAALPPAERRAKWRDERRLFRVKNPEADKAIRERARAKEKRVNHERLRMRGRVNAALRRARKKGNLGADRVDYEAILKRDGLVCHICGLPILPSQLEFDHVIPLARGGAHSALNIKPSHALCNRRKGARL